jgi:hypothetical protein
MFPTGTPGPSAPPAPVSTKMSAEEGAKLMMTDYEKWKELYQQNKIERA